MFNAERNKGGKTVSCKLCGVEIPGIRIFDPDQVQQHAHLYHVDLIDLYGFKGAVQLIRQGKVTVTRELTIEQLRAIGELEA
jgi:hypothetical protein